MDCLKKIVCIVVSLCMATLACNPEDPVLEKRGRRMAAPRLAGARWAPYSSEPGDLVMTCTEKKAPDLLESAGGDCLNAAIRILERRGSPDLPAAYLLRAARSNNALDLPRALETADDELRKNPGSREARFNKALAQQKLGFFDEAMTSWNQAAANDDPEWAAEARARRKELSDRLAQNSRWHAELDAALQTRDRDAVTKLVMRSPYAATRYFEESDLKDRERLGLLAAVLAETGDRYAVDLLGAVARTNDLSARYNEATARFTAGKGSLELLDSMRVPPDYRDLATRVHMLRGNALEYRDRYLEARTSYETAMRLAGKDASAKAAVLLRRSNNSLALGDQEAALRDAVEALALLPEVPRPWDQSRVYDSAALAMESLREFPLALQYRNAAVAATNKPPVSSKYQSIALRQRADTLAAMGRPTEAIRDLNTAADLAESVANTNQRALLKMRIDEIAAQLLVGRSPRDAVAKLTDAIALAPAQDSSHRVILRYKRAIARRAADDPAAEEDLREAFRILQTEALGLLESRHRGQFEELWTKYFARFEAMQRDLIVSRIGVNDVNGAFVYAEQTRAFEPMHLLLQTGAAPPGFVRIQTVADLGPSKASLPADTVVLQYLVLADRTYVWVLTRDRLRLVPLPVAHYQIEEWANQTHDAIASGQWPLLHAAMRAAYGQLVREALSATAPRSRIVIVPDGPMHALPFAALNDAGGYLIERASIAIAGSTSLYLYALHRDRELAANAATSVLIVGEPGIDPRLGLSPLPFAEAEARELKSFLYKDAETLYGTQATTRQFLAAAKNATIIHFAGHGRANPARPWTSMLFLAPEGADRGELTAWKLLTEAPDLAKTRLIVLAACDTASGDSVGPEGVAPLVRPLIAARVPAVVGTLTDVSDATAKDLLVSFHCHYRHGDDVAVALQNAQRAMLRKTKSAGAWALFQVVGYAGSPYPRSAALEDNSELFPCQNLLYRSDGLHSQ
jgi:CHAT domain-containing protein/tetratricopeptide (TPR) repeat protein